MLFHKNAVFFLTWHVEIIKNVELVVEICVCRIDFTALSPVEIWGRDHWLLPIGHSHLMLTSVVSLLLTVVFIRVFQKKWGDAVWLEC